MKAPGTLVFFCGKMGSGKSSAARKLARELDAVFLSEDKWLSQLYPAEIASLNDYLKCSTRLKTVVAPHVRDLLISGISVVMDFPGNTRQQRDWFKASFLGTGAAHRLIYLEASDELCLSRLAIRREREPERAAFDTEAVFRRVTSHFNGPAEDEGFNVETWYQAKTGAAHAQGIEPQARKQSI